MAKIQIYYFSGTGNTEYVVKEIAKGLIELGNEVNFNSCEEEVEINREYDLLGIAFPIHISFAPDVFKKFLERLPKVNSKPFFGVATAGYMAGDVLAYEGKNLINKGYKPFLYRSIVVANNLHLPFLCPLKVVSKDKLNKRMGKIHNEIDDIVDKVNNQTKDIRGNNPIGKVFGILQRSVKDIHEGIGFKGFTADESCIKCKWCIENCPTKNIVFKDNNIVFEDRCIICMRCYSLCPKEAIQMTEGTKNRNKYVRYKGI